MDLINLFIKSAQMDKSSPNINWALYKLSLVLSLRMNWAVKIRLNSHFSSPPPPAHQPPPPYPLIQIGKWGEMNM